jgi:hypothetical protein
MKSEILDNFGIFKTRLYCDEDVINANKLIDYKNFDIKSHIESELTQETPK